MMFRFVVPAIGGTGFALVAVAALLWASVPRAGPSPGDSAATSTAMVDVGAPALTAPEASTPAAADQPAAAPYEQGRELFIAKGCITCHRHKAAGASGSYEVGPDLTMIESVPYDNLPNSEDFLRKWLKDPGAIKPSTAMPNLGLTDEEIEELLAFLVAVDG